MTDSERALQREWAKERKLAWLGAAVATVAGFVDAVGYLTLFGLFTANMTGNSVRLGLAISRLDWATALFRLTPLLGFVLGVALGSSLLEVATRKHLRPLVALILGLESTLLLAFCVGDAFWRRPGLAWRPTDGFFYLFVALLTLAMGLQNTTLRRVGKRIIHTTFVTGMITEVTIELVKLLFWFGDRLHGPGAHRLKRAFTVARRQTSFNRLIALAAILVCYVAGAIVGGIGVLRLGSVALVAPIVVLVAIAMLDALQPLYPSGDPEWRTTITRSPGDLS